jgi:hypothetical protein
VRQVTLLSKANDTCRRRHPNRRCRARPLEAERICTTDALGQFWPKTFLLILTGTMMRMMAVTGAPLITNQAGF